MADLEPIGRLELDEDLTFQKRMWAAERIGWAAMGALCALGLAGLLGGGVLAQRELAVGGGSVRYEAIVRKGAITPLELQLPAGRGEAGVALDRGFLAAHEIVEILPEPEDVSFDRGRLRFRFGGEAGTVRFLLEPREIGRIAGAVTLGDAETRLEQFALP